jgi:hypothetical protein
LINQRVEIVVTATLTNLTTIAGRAASRSSALVSDALNSFVRTIDMATKSNDRTDRAAARAAADSRSSSLRPTLNERHESISIQPAGFPTFGYPTFGYPCGNQWLGNGSRSIRGGKPRIAGENRLQ